MLTFHVHEKNGSPACDAFIIARPHRADVQPNQEATVVLGGVQLGTAQVAAKSTLPLGKITDTLAMALQAVTSQNLQQHLAQYYSLKHTDLVDIIALKYTHRDPDAMRIMLMTRYDCVTKDIAALPAHCHQLGI